MAVLKYCDLVDRLKVVFDDNKKLNHVCTEIAEDVQGAKVKLVEVIEHLGGLLTNPDMSMRQNGIHSLTLVLQQLDKNFLNEQEIQFLTSFYCDRLQDHNTMIPDIIQGFLSIIQMPRTSKDSVIKIFHSLFNNIRCQSELQEIRHDIYEIITSAFRNKLNDLKLMGPDFVYGVISSMDGESDPRNLILLFNFLPKFMGEFQLGHLTEEMFEVLACYFPIDFNSVGFDRREITREDLRRGLEICLTSVSGFGEFSLPLIIEKLDSDVKKAKIDSLSLLARGSVVYGHQIIHRHVDELWTLMRRELLPGTDQDTKNMAYAAIDQMVLALANDGECLERFINKVFADLKYSLSDVQLSLYWPSVKILETIGKAETSACVYVLKIIIPLCLGQYSANTSNSNKLHLVTTLNQFLTISSSFGLQIKDVSELSWTDIPNLYLNDLDISDLSLKTKIVEGLSIQSAALTKPQRGIVYNKISENIDNQDDEIFINICYNLLISFSRIYPDEILDTLFMRKLQIVSNLPKKVLKKRMGASAAISKLVNVGKKILPILIESATSRDHEIRLITLSCIQNMLETQTFEFDVFYYLYDDCDVLARILDFDKMDVDGESDEIYFIAQICRLIIRKLSADHQKNIVDKYCQNLTDKVNKNIELIEGLLTPLMPCNISQEFMSLMEYLIENAIMNNDDKIRLSCCRLSASLINKFSGKSLEKMLNIIRETICNVMEIIDEDLEKKKAAVILNIWCTKALIAAGCEKSQDFLDYQLNILKYDKIGRFAGEQFKILVDKNDHTLIEENYCNIRLLYKQRIFQNVINQNSLFNDQSRQNYLIAFIYLAEEMPKEILLMYLLKVVPLLIESLSLDDGQLILSTLKILKFLLEMKHEVFTDKIQSFIPMCLKLTTYPNMNVRIAAHECLHSYCYYPTVIIKPYKDDILDKLSQTVDDKKRLVRKAAVITRTRWFLVGSPGEPE